MIVIGLCAKMDSMIGGFCLTDRQWWFGLVYRSVGGGGRGEEQGAALREVLVEKGYRGEPGAFQGRIEIWSLGGRFPIPILFLVHEVLKCLRAGVSNA